MRLRSLTAMLLCLGLGVPGATRELHSELEVLHLGGLLTASELDALLADPRLRIEAHYQPTRLIDGVTARRERVLPLGSQLFAIAQRLTLGDDALQRQGRRLQWRVPDTPAGHVHYRLQSLRLHVPIPRAAGRPQPELEIPLMDEPPAPAGIETASLSRHGAFELGWRLRLRWLPGGPEPLPTTELRCPPDVLRQADGRYRFRTNHPVEGFFDRVVSERPASRLRQPLAADLAGWQWMDDTLLRQTIGPWQVERLRLYGEQRGPGECRRTRLHEGLLANGQPVRLQRSVTESGCGGSDNPRSVSVLAHWLDDGSLAQWQRSDLQATRSWDAFAAQEVRCGSEPAPAAAETQALGQELLRLRDAFAPP